MKWDIINIIDQPQCRLCGITTKQMAQFVDTTNQYVYICSNCGPHVKAAMIRWTELKSPNHIALDKNNIFDSDYIDYVIDKHEHK